MSDPNKNIIIILNEDHGQWALSSYGNRDVNTPTLDYLAKTGVQMENKSPIEQETQNNRNSDE